MLAAPVRDLAVTNLDDGDDNDDGDDSDDGDDIDGRGGIEAIEHETKNESQPRGNQGGGTIGALPD